MSLLGRDQILAATALRSEDVEIPDWAGAVRVREMTAGEHEAYARSLLGPDGTLDLTSYQAKLLTQTVCDETGALLFAPGDVVTLQALPAAALGRLWDVAARLNLIEAGSVEELGKALAARGGASSSSLPSSSAAPSERSSGA